MGAVLVAAEHEEDRLIEATVEVLEEADEEGGEVEVEEEETEEEGTNSTRAESTNRKINPC